jgi:hypothetical protein
MKACIKNLFPCLGGASRAAWVLPALIACLPLILAESAKGRSYGETANHKTMKAKTLLFAVVACLCMLFTSPPATAQQPNPLPSDVSIEFSGLANSSGEIVFPEGTSAEIYDLPGVYDPEGLPATLSAQGLSGSCSALSYDTLVNYAVVGMPAPCVFVEGPLVVIHAPTYSDTLGGADIIWANSDPSSCNITNYYVMMVDIWAYPITSTNNVVMGSISCTCDGSSITNASVYIGDYSGTSDTNGNYDISDIPPGTYSATVSANNYFTVTNTVTVPSSVQLVTNNFALPPVSATITVSPSPANGGTVAGGGTYAIGSQVQISAAAAMFYTFAGWSDGNTDNPRTITVPSGGATYTVLFSPKAILTCYHQPGDTANSYGHVFLSLTSVNGDDTQYYGFYFNNFASALLCDAPGAISGYEPSWDYAVSYPLTINQYDSAAGLVTYDMFNLPTYCLYTFNCMDWVASIANSAGIQLPLHKEAIGISDPKIFGQILSSLVGVIVSNDGLVIQNSSGNNSQAISPLGKPTPLGSTTNQTPYDYSYSGLENAGHSDPADLATFIGIGYDPVNCGTNNANIDSGLTLNIVGTNAFQSLISMNWGDGSVFEVQSLTFSHVYSVGTYQADLLIIDTGAVHSYNMTVVVSASPASLITVNVTPFAPVIIPNEGLVPANPVPDYLPIISSQPTSIMATAGSNAVFSVTAGGANPLGYQWLFNGTNVSNATNSVLSITNPQPANAGSYSVIVSNLFGCVTSGVATLTVYYANLVSNGGFETGDFTGWTLSGDSGNISYDTLVDNGSEGITPYSGKYEALLGSSGSLGYLSQTLSTAAGATYLLSFWLNNIFNDPNVFMVSWNGNTLLDTTNFNANNWTNLQFVATAAGTSTVLQFGFEDNVNWLGLDDVSVMELPPTALPDLAGISLSGTNLVINGSNGFSGMTCYVLMSTNVALPLNQWTPVATNALNASGNFTIMATNAVNLNVPQCFFILQTQ